MKKNYWNQIRDFHIMLDSHLLKLSSPLKKKKILLKCHPLRPKTLSREDDNRERTQQWEKCQNSLFPNDLSNERERCSSINDPTHMGCLMLISRAMKIFIQLIWLSSKSFLGCSNPKIFPYQRFRKKDCAL